MPRENHQFHPEQYIFFGLLRHSVSVDIPDEWTGVGSNVTFADQK